MSTLVESRIRAALEHEPAVNLHKDRIDVDYENGVASLSGEVASIAAKRLEKTRAAAEFDAWAVFGVDKVVNRIEVELA